MARHAWLLILAGTSWGASPVDAIFAPYNTPGSPGCAAGVLDNGKIALAKGYGLANLDYGIPLTAKSRFYMASVSKQFTSMAALLAEREGRFRLDDPITRHFPEMPAYAARIPLRRMLDHTAGLRDYLTLWGLKGWSNESVLTEAPTLALITRQKALDFEPGSAYSYSNTGYFLMMLLIERTTGQRLDAYLQQRLFQPLGMTATRFQHDHAEPMPDRAQGYRREPGGGWRTAAVGFDIVGSGGLYSNIEDMLRWASNFEEPKAAGSSLGALQTPGHLNDGTETPRGYALGLMRDTIGGLTRISHAGGATGYRTFFLRFPTKKLTVVTLCNAGDANVEDLAMRTAAVFAPELKPEKPRVSESPARGLLSAEQRKALAGTYYSDELETVWRIVERGGHLFRESEGGESEILRDGKGTLTTSGATIVPGEHGFSVSAGRAHGIWFGAR